MKSDVAAFPCLSFSNGLALELIQREGLFLGLGEIFSDGMPLRSGRRPMFVEIRTPNGEKLCDFRLQQLENDGDGAVLEFAAAVETGGPMEWMVHETRPRLNTGDWSCGPKAAPDVCLRLHIQPVSRLLDGRSYQGFSYRYSYRSEQFPIYKILDRSTWEIGGMARGNEIWMRSTFEPWIREFSVSGDFYSSERYQPDAENPNIFQFLPFQTELQGFSFTASTQGVLMTWATEVAHVRSLFEKGRGNEEIAHFHEHCDDLNTQFHSAPMEVLFCPARHFVGGVNRLERANAFEAMRDFVSQTLHDEIGLRRERVTTYGHIEEWGPADISRYTRLGVPRLTAAGVQTIEVFNHFQNNMNTLGVSNACCTLNYQWAENIGAQKMRALCDTARAGGARVLMWGNTALSTLNWMKTNRPGTDGNIWLNKPTPLQNSPAPWVRNSSGAIEADHYAPIFCVLNLRDDIARDYWLQGWKDAHEEVGLGGIFWDSSFNLSSDKFHWVPNACPEAHTRTSPDQLDTMRHGRPDPEPPRAILSQYRAHLELVRDFQREVGVYCNEDLGVFGVHRHGPPLARRLDNLFLWPDCLVPFNAPAIEAAGYNADDIFFRALAYRMMWILYWNIEGDCLSWGYSGKTDSLEAWQHPTPAQLSLLRLFSQVSDRMIHREILPNETGVLYHDNKGRGVLWAFETCEIRGGGSQVLRALPGQVRCWDANGEFTAEENP